ncbi:MAG: hypothetical protein OXN44_04865 [Acidimicrobiaceae bacterium]|nr:hypothetical protein [Acidimicrobiaceae bacterium]MDE0607259.1 hypothetical protein [Acidimicrobiaceae bacterium]
MFTTGFKFFFGIGMALATGAVFYGYTTGGNHMGPLSMGWKGGIGEHLGYSLLLGLGVAAMTVALFLVFFRDADPAAQAHYMGVEQIPTNDLVTASFWPVVGAFGVGAMAIGLVLHTAVFVTGLIICGVVAIEWLMDAWADRATGDPEANRALRNRVMAPIEIPALGAAIAALGVLATSRILLATSKLGSVVVAGVVSVLILGIAVLFARKTQINKNILAGSVLLLAVAVLVGGVVATVTGERDFHPHEVHEDEYEGTGSEGGH